MKRRRRRVRAHLLTQISSNCYSLIYSCFTKLSTLQSPLKILLILRKLKETSHVLILEYDSYTFTSTRWCIEICGYLNHVNHIIKAIIKIMYLYLSFPDPNRVSQNPILSINGVNCSYGDISLYR